MIANRCPVCLALPNKPCYNIKGNLVKTHSGRFREDGTDWAERYDSLYRELPIRKRFDLHPYLKRTA